MNSYDGENGFEPTSQNTASLIASLALRSVQEPVGPIKAHPTPEEQIQSLLHKSDGSINVGSKNGQILGLSGRLDRIREIHDSGRGMAPCYWGAFVK